jgi:hypothetical protein
VPGGLYLTTSYRELSVTSSQAWFARTVAELAEMSGEQFVRDGLARLLARACAQIHADCEIGVVVVGDPDVVVGSTARASALESLGLHLGEGAAADLLRAGALMPGTALDDLRWPGYAPAARKLGYQSVHSFGLVHAGQPVGVINLFGPPQLASPAAQEMQALADLAAAHITRESALRAACERADQLAGALASRVLIEQAKGMVAAWFSVPMESAFGSLRRHARDHNERLSDLCASVTSGDTDLAEIRVGFFAMSSSRRAQLRDRAIERWRQTSADALEQRERASAIVSRSVELRVELDHNRSLRETQAMGRAIDRYFRQLTRTSQGTDKRPTVLIGATGESIRSFVVSALRGEARLAFADDQVSDAEVLGVSIVQQPDLVILGTDAAGAPDEKLVTQLRRYCPDSRRLVVVELERDGPVLAASRVDAVVVCGDAPALLSCALKLCGVRPHAPAAGKRPGAPGGRGARS